MDDETFNRFELAGWDSAGKADRYHDFFGPITGRAIEPLLDAAGVRAGLRVLDVGTGPGYAAAAAAGRGADVIGVDFSSQMVALASRLHPAVRFQEADAEELPFGDSSFDAVVANFALLHLGHPERAAAELARVLVPGGRAALTVWDVPEKARYLAVFAEAVQAAGAVPPSDLPPGPPFFRFSADSEFAGLLRSAGLKSVRIRRLAFVLNCSGPDELWEGVLGGAVRTTALIAGQPVPTQRLIRAEFERLVEPYMVGRRLAIPVSIKLASGRRPG